MTSDNKKGDLGHKINCVYYWLSIYYEIWYIFFL